MQFITHPSFTHYGKKTLTKLDGLAMIRNNESGNPLFMQNEISRSVYRPHVIWRLI